MTVTIIKSKCPIVKNLSVLLLGFVTFLLKIIEVHYRMPDQIGIDQAFQSLLCQKKRVKNQKMKVLKGIRNQKKSDLRQEERIIKRPREP